MSEQKITQAAEATDAIQRHVGQAIKVLTDSFYGRVINGWGVYSDVSSQRRKLKEAIGAPGGSREGYERHRVAVPQRLSGRVARVSQAEQGRAPARLALAVDLPFSLQSAL
jgi:hypothetical protein